MQRFQHVIMVTHVVTAAQFHHVQAIASNKKYPVKIIGRDKVLFPKTGLIGSVTQAIYDRGDSAYNWILGTVRKIAAADLYRE